MISDSPAKDPVKVAAGAAGARARWANHTPRIVEPRIVRLDDLSAEQRRLVLALVAAARSAQATDAA